jgi:hypothetical protein
VCNPRKMAVLKQGNKSDKIDARKLADRLRLNDLKPVYHGETGSKVPASRMRYVEHIEHHGKALFERVCQMDLEGIVAKHSFGNYVTEAQRTTWFKIKNRSYSQSVGREKLFDRERHREPVPGWHSCELACAEVENALSD